jgi:hypothetical protein
MEEWWGGQLKRSRAARPAAATPAAEQVGEGKQAEKVEKPKEEANESSSESVTDRGDSEKDAQQWGGALPGHGGT